jgi:hypothetical protein
MQIWIILVEKQTDYFSNQTRVAMLLGSHFFSLWEVQSEFKLILWRLTVI